MGRKKNKGQNHQQQKNQQKSIDSSFSYFKEESQDQQKVSTTASTPIEQRSKHNQSDEPESINISKISQKQPLNRYGSKQLYPNTSFTGNKNNYQAKNSELKDNRTIQKKHDYSSQDFSDEEYTRKLDLSMKQWLLIGMSKIIPHKDTEIKLNLKKNQVSGDKQKVDKFCQKVSNEIIFMKLKILKLEVEISPEELQVEMEDEWKAKIYTSLGLKKVGERIQKMYNLNNQIINDIDKILSRDGITNYTRFLLIKGDCYQDAADVIDKIHAREKKKLSTSILKDLELLDQQESPQPIRKNPSKNQAQKSQKKAQQSEQMSQNSRSFDSNYFSRRQQQNKTLRPNNQRRMTENQSFSQFVQETSQLSRIQPEERRSLREQRGPRENLQGRGNRRGNRAPVDRRILFTQQYPERYLDKNDLKGWVKKSRDLNVNDLEINEKFDPEANQLIFEVVFYGEDPNGKKRYALDFYFNHLKVIKLQEEPELREKIIQRFVSDNTWMKIEYKKVYTQKKYPSYPELKELAKKDNSAQHRLKHTNLTHVLLLTGLKSQIDEFQQQIQDFKRQIKQTCRRVEVRLKYTEISQFIRTPQVFDIVEESITQCLSSNAKKYILNSIRQIFSEVNVELDLLNVSEKDVNREIQFVKEKLEKLVSSFQFDKDTYKSSKSVFQALKKQFLLEQNLKGGITLISKENQIKQNISYINNELKQNFKPVVKQYIVKQKSQFTLLKQFLARKTKEAEFSDIQIRFEQGDKNYKIAFFGPEIVIDDLIAKTDEYASNLAGKLYSFYVNMTEEQLQIIEKDKQVQKHVTDTWKIALQFKKDYSVGAIFKVEPISNNQIKYKTKTIFFETEFNFESMPKKSVFFFRTKNQVDLVKQPFILPLKNQVKDLTKSVFYEDKNKNSVYIFQSNANPTQIFTNAKQRLNDFTHFFMYLPENQQGGINQFIKQMIIEICNDKDLINRELKITIIGKKNAQFKKVLKFQEGKTKQSKKTIRKWYTLQNKDKLYYADEGNKKIEDGLKNNLTEVQLQNKDLNLTIKTHKFDFSKGVMTHLRGGVSIPITVSQDKITYNINGVLKTVPDLQFQQIPKVMNQGFFRNNAIPSFQDCQLSIGLYKIDIINRIQTNLFTNYSRTLGFDQVQEEKQQNYALEVSYDVKQSKLELQYTEQHQNFLKQAVKFIQQHLSKKMVEVQKPFTKDFTLELISKFQDDAKQHNIQVFQSQDGKNGVFRAYNEKNIERFLKILGHLSEQIPKDKNQIEFPKEWQPQTKDIETFVVPKNTIQFNTVQTAFTTGRIVQLIRIQNKLVYKRFFQQKLFLKQINGGKNVKQMLLYHGTRQTDPKLIYEDKQECFNINYTGEHNLLGRGTYFAQRSEYSHSYSYAENQMLRGSMRSMFYCNVLVGQSQKCPKHDGNIRDTGYKDPVNKIKFQSMTDFLQGSNVFVVYKNKRAYPLYLIKYQ